VDHAASPLTPLLDGRYTVGDYLQALEQSLEELGLHATLSADAAGLQTLELLQQLVQAAATSTTQLDWQGFRSWLGRNLERATFRVAPSASPVRLLTLEQTRLQRFDGVIVAGCSQDQLPGAPPGQTFFNQRVRAQLQLPTWSQTVALKLYDFCRVLHSGKHLLLTRHSESDGEPVAASPWLVLLETFHANAYRTDLSEATLLGLVRSRAAQPASPDTAPLPAVAQRPAPQAPPALQPRSWSAYTHQRLVDCPYRFFAADTLGLKPQEEIREALSKSDYGSLIHRVLQAFHSDVGGLPGPWSGPLTDANREAAQALLHNISDVVFTHAVEDNFQARSWLHQWLACVPGYLDWLIKRQPDWQLRAVELKAERDISERLRLKGRIDRVDQQAGRLAVVDYKTGKPPSQDDVLRGEAVQLSSYALLLETPVEQLDYVELAKDNVKPTTCAQGEDLQPLLQQIEQRLTVIDRALQDGVPLPAWGDDKVCGYCEFSGLCRRDTWLQDNDKHD
jgi:ATP-dependent helicase/nuclease subunit B